MNFKQTKELPKKKVLCSLISALCCSGGVHAQDLPPISLVAESLTLTTSGTYSETVPPYNAVWDLSDGSSLTANAPGISNIIDLNRSLAIGINLNKSTVNVNNLDINLQGNDLDAIVAQDGSQVYLTDARLKASGPNTRFYVSNGPDVAFVLKNNSVELLNNSGYALVPDVVALYGDRSSFTADGWSFVDYDLDSRSAVFNLSSNDVTVNLNNASVTNASWTVFSVNGDNGRLSATNSTFKSDAQALVGILVGQGRTFTADFTNSSLQANKAVWQSEDGGTLNLTADRSSFTGISQLNGSTAKINASLNNNSSWTITGNSNISNLSSNNSLLQFAAAQGDLASAASYKTLTIQESYDSNGGVIALNTRLGGDDSPTDVVVLDGATITGQTGLRIINSGGMGESTGVGIRVVQTLNGATTREDSFYLDSRSPNYRPSTGTLSVYGYEYSLVRGGDGGVSNDWYLDSFMDGPTPGPRPTPDSVINLSPELGAYVGNQVAAMKMFALSRDDRDLSRVAFTGDHRRGFWMRVQGDRDQNMKMETGRVTMSTNTYMLQLGGDVWSRKVAEQGRMAAGLMAGYGEARTNAQSQVFVRAANRSLRAVDLNANGTVKGYAVGAYFTWLANETTRLGTYVDSWIQYGHFNNSLSGELGSSSYNSQLWSVSLESGYALKPLASSRLVLEPQAQLTYSHYSADSMNLTNVPVKSMDYNEVNTRLGMRVYPLGKTMQSSNIRPFAELNWLYRSGTPKVDVGPYDFSIVPLRNAAQLKLGVEGKIGKSLYLTGQIMGYTGSDSQRGYGGMINATYRW